MKSDSGYSCIVNGKEILNFVLNEHTYDEGWPEITNNCYNVKLLFTCDGDET